MGRGFLVALAVAAAYAALAVVAVIALDAQRRARESAFLRTLGLTDRQLVGLTVVEHAPPVSLALLIGIGLGLGVAWLLAPGLELAVFIDPARRSCSRSTGGPWSRSSSRSCSSSPSRSRAAPGSVAGSTPARRSASGRHEVRHDGAVMTDLPEIVDLPGAEERARRPRERFGDQTLIVCDNLVKIYKVADLEVVALQGLDLLVERGEFVAIVGASGSGKSTLSTSSAGSTSRRRGGRWWPATSWPS